MPLMITVSCNCLPSLAKALCTAFRIENYLAGVLAGLSKEVRK